MIKPAIVSSPYEKLFVVLGIYPYDGFRRLDRIHNMFCGHNMSQFKTFSRRHRDDKSSRTKFDSGSFPFRFKSRNESHSF